MGRDSLPVLSGDSSRRTQNRQLVNTSPLDTGGIDAARAENGAPVRA